MLKLTEKDFKKIDKFNSTLKSLLTLACQIDPKNNEIDRLKRLASIGASTNPVDLYTETAPNFKKHKEKIENKDADFFMDMGFSEDMYENPRVVPLFVMIVEKWEGLSLEIKEDIWGKVRIMLECASPCARAD